MIRKLKLSLALIAIGVVMVSCSGYEKVLKSKDYDFKYKKALEYYGKGDHYRYTTLFEQLVPIYKGTQRSDTVEFYMAMGYFNQGDFILAGHYYDKFRKTYLRSVFTEEADFMYSYCYYQSSPRPELDQDNTQAAIISFSEFLSKYPKTSKRAEVNTILNELKNKLIEKSYLSSKLYFNVSNYKAAIVSLKNSVDEFPNSKYREEQLYLILKSAYLLAENSVPEKKRERYQSTIDEYYTFISEFPETTYMKDAQRIYEVSIKLLEN